MSTMEIDRSNPVSSSEFAAVDLQRVAEISVRHRQISNFLQSENYGAILLQKPENLSWLTAGSDCQRGLGPATSAAIFVTPDSRVVVCSNVATAQLFETDLAGFGFQLKERPWYEPRDVLLGDLCRGRRVASDTGAAGTTDVSLRLTGLRLPYVDFDVEQVRHAGRVVAHAVEATARGLVAGRHENEVAGELAHRILKYGGQPVRLQVLMDGRGQRFRHWGHDDSAMFKTCTLLAVARIRGRHVAAARTVSLGPVPEAFKADFEKMSLILATGMFFSQEEWELYEVWNRVRRIYEKAGAEDEWRAADQACIAEYAFEEISLAPTSQYRLSTGVPVFWHPSVGTALGGETVLVTSKGPELLTPATDWPQLSIAVKGAEVLVPGILELPG